MAHKQKIAIFLERRKRQDGLSTRGWTTKMKAAKPTHRNYSNKLVPIIVLNSVSSRRLQSLAARLKITISQPLKILRKAIQMRKPIAQYLNSSRIFFPSKSIFKQREYQVDTPLINNRQICSKKINN